MAKDHKKENQDELEVNTDEVDTLADLEEAKKKKLKEEEAEDNVDTPEEDDNAEDDDAQKEAYNKKQAKIKKENMTKFDEILDGEEALEESFKEKSKALFEAHVEERVNAHIEAFHQVAEARVAKKIEKAEKALEDEFAQKETEMLEMVERYMNDLAEEWFKENKIAVENAHKVEIAENIVNSLRATLVENQIDVPEEQEPLVDNLAEEIETLNKKVDSMMSEKAKMQMQIDGFVALKLFEDVSEGLSEAQKDRFKAIVGTLDFEDAKSFKTKLESLKESFVESRAPRRERRLPLISERRVVDENKKSQINENNEDSLINEVLRNLRGGH